MGTTGASLHAGSVIAGKYRLEHPLGEGAMGVVWAAVNTATERRVAIKVMASVLAGSEEGRARLLREARACGRISHPNVIEVLDAGETDDGAPYIVMPRLVGETLAARIEREGPMTDRAAASVALDIARGLAAAHVAGIVHRDLKPGNVFLVREPETGGDAVKLLDFGVSKMFGAVDAAATATGSALGSPAYMAPEQVRGARDIDHRADLWALGVVVFEMVTGVLPFVGDTVYAVAGEILSGQIPDVRERVPSADPRLAAIIASCLERDVRRRVATAGEIVQNLRAFLGVPVAAPSGPALAYDDRTQVMQPQLQPQLQPQSQPRPLAQPVPGPRQAPSPPSVTSTTPFLGGPLAHAAPRASGAKAAAVGALGAMALLIVGAAVFFGVHRSSQDNAVAPTEATVTHPGASVPATGRVPAAPSAEQLPRPTAISTPSAPSGSTMPTAAVTASPVTTAAASGREPARAVETVETAKPVRPTRMRPATPTAKTAAPKPTIRLPTDPG